MGAQRHVVGEDPAEPGVGEQPPAEAGVDPVVEAHPNPGTSQLGRQRGRPDNAVANAGWQGGIG